MLNLMRLSAPARRRAGDEAGALAVIVAVSSLVLLITAALAVDVGNTWARRGQLQTQADKAALFAAEYLPIDTTSDQTTATTQTTVAKAVAYYLACHPVQGQSDDLNPAFDQLPACSSTLRPSSSALDQAAAEMLAAGRVSFPTSTQVRVLGPRARVDYGFGNAAGVSESVQAKEATARVASPGQVMPMGGSLGCIAASAASTQLLNVGDTLSGLVPINYFSAGDGSNSLSGGSAGAVVWPSTPPPPALPQQLTITGANTVGNNLTFNYSLTTGVSGLLGGLLSNLLNNLAGMGVEVIFGRGSAIHTATATVTVAGAGSVTLPGPVQSAPGEWQVKVVAYLPNLSATTIFGTTTYTQAPGYHQNISSNSWPINAPAGSLSDLTDLDNFLSCAKPLDSPRLDTADRSQRMIKNIREGLDHALAQHPSLISAIQSVSASTSLSSLVSGALTDPSGLALSCGSSTPHVRDETAGQSTRPNCVRVDTTRSWAYEFTQGFLTPDGRFSCSVADCSNGSFTLPAEVGIGGTYNDDQLTDFIRTGAPATVLNDLLLQGLDTYLLPGLPILTPTGNIQDEIYASPRFFWAPVLTTVFTTNSDNQFPILTFRPVFITQEQPDNTAGKRLVDLLASEIVRELRGLLAGGITSLLSGLGLSDVLDEIGLGTPVDDLMDSLGGTGKIETHGLVLDTAAAADSRLKAVRVMTLAPDAMPVVDADYDGPLSEYLGSGPKVVRLVD